MKHIYCLAEHVDVTMAPEIWREKVLEAADSIINSAEVSKEGCTTLIFWPEHAIYEGIKAVENRPGLTGSGCPYDLSVEKNVSLLASWGCKATLIGLADQRSQISAIMKEAGVQDLSGMNRYLNRQIGLSHKNGMTAVYAVGESAQQRARGRWQELLKAQIEIGMYQVNPQKTVLAYQPGWEISEQTLPQLEETIAYLKRVSDGMEVVVMGQGEALNSRKTDGWIFTAAI